MMTNLLLSLLLILSTGAVAVAAAPSGPATRPTTGPAPKRVLVFSLTKGFRHASIPTGKAVLEKIGRESGAYQAVVSDDLEQFDPETLNAYDAVVFNLTTGELPFTDEQKKALVDFVAGGKGFIGIHSATDTFYQWPEFGKLIGGYFDGHPWNAGDTVTIKIEKDSPITRPFGPGAFELKEEIYQFKDPYARHACSVHMSLDTEKTDMTKKGIKRTDGDFPVAWTKPYGNGRVFYTSLGHNESVWNDPRYQGHLLAGIRYALGQAQSEE